MTLSLKRSMAALVVAGLQRFVAEAIHDGFGEDHFLGITLASFGEKLRGFGGATRLVEKIEEVILVFGEDRERARRERWDAR